MMACAFDTPLGKVAVRSCQVNYQASAGDSCSPNATNRLLYHFDYRSLYNMNIAP